MNRTTRMLIVVAIAVVTATLASVAAFIAIRRRPAVQVEVPSAFVVVAARSLELGVSLAGSDVSRIAWPGRNPVAGSFSKIDDIVNRGLVASVAENEPITEAKLAPLAAGAGLPPAIRPGMRAMSVKVNEVIGVAGFVVPGTKVDVLVTIREARESVSRIVVSNVQVLTAGSRYDEAEAKKAGKPIASTVVTLMVSPTDAERIALAGTEGQIMLALRNPLDTATILTPGIRTAALMDTEPPAPVAAERPPVRRAVPMVPPQPQTARIALLPIASSTTVETIKAGKRQVEVLR